MFKPNSSEARRLPPLAASFFFCVALLQSPAASARLAVAEEEPAPGVERSAAPLEKSPAASSGYRLRCWQHGRLLFEETDVALPPEGSRYALKFAGRDRNGRPLYVAETLNATCLARAAPAPVVNPALPR